MARLDVTQKDVTAPAIAGGILPPARHVDIAPPAVTGARRGQHHGVSSIGKQMSARDRGMRGYESPEHGWYEFADVPGSGYFLSTGPCNQNIAWSALLQQQFRILHHGVGVKAAAHRTIGEDVR